MKLLLVGLGRISNTHIEAIQKNKLSIECVLDVDYSKVRKLAEKLKCEYINDYNSIPEYIDTAIIMTPSGLHPDNAKEIINKTKIKRIIIEKPLSLTYREAVELYKCAEKKEVILLPVYQNRYNPIIQCLKSTVQCIGKLYQFNCNVFWNRNENYFQNEWHGVDYLDGGVLYTQASHYIDMLLYLFGSIDECKGYGGKLRNLEVYDSCSASLKFKNGIIGSLNATINTYEKNYNTELTIIAENGTIKLSGTNLNTIEFWNVKNIKKPDLGFKINHIYGNGHIKLYEYLKTKQYKMFPSKKEVLDGIRLMEKMSI